MIAVPADGRRVGGGGAGTPGPRSHIAAGTSQGPDNRPGDALSTAHADSLTALAGAFEALYADHKANECPGCVWFRVTPKDVALLHEVLTHNGYQVVPL